MFEHVQVGASRGDPTERDRRSLRRWILATVAYVTVVHLVTWPLTLFLVGPVLGTAVLALTPNIGTGVPVVVEGVLVVAAVTTAIVVGVRVTANSGRLLGWVLIIEVVEYLGSVVVFLLADGGLADLLSAVAFLWPFAVANLPVLCLGLTIVRKAGAIRCAS